MPASMMRADTGATLNVIGSSIAIVASGPMPGSTPISVPRKTPMKQNHRFCSESATLKPRIRLLKRSMSVPRPEWIREAEPVDEKADRPDRDADREQHLFPELEFLARQGRREHERNQGRDEARLFHQHPEDHRRERQHDEPADRPVADDRVGFDRADDELPDPEGDHDAAE